MSYDIYKYICPIGDIICIFAGPFLVEIDIGSQTVKSAVMPLPACRLRTELDAYFSGKIRAFRQRIKFIIGTAFEQKVWTALEEIPYGETRSYSWVAEVAERPKAFRAVGQALKKNPLPIILPCHRVIASDGSPGGYSRGVTIKEWLLRHEKTSHQLPAK